MSRRMISLLGIGLVMFGINGCDDGVGEGTPANVDMTKDYSPKTEMPGMSPKIQKKALKKAAASSAPPAAVPGSPGN